MQFVKLGIEMNLQYLRNDVLLQCQQIMNKETEFDKISQGS